MADIKTAEQRSYNMASIHGKNTKPEMYFRKQLFALGYRYRLHAPGLWGHPDLYLPKYKTAVFIHGCFWHRHPECKYASTPKSRVEFWNEKFKNNVERDNRIMTALQERGIKCLIVWECTIKKMMKSNPYRDAILGDVKLFLESDQLKQEL